MIYLGRRCRRGRDLLVHVALAGAIVWALVAMPTNSLNNVVDLFAAEYTYNGADVVDFIPERGEI